MTAAQQTQLYIAIPLKKNLARTGFLAQDVALLDTFFSEFGKTDTENQLTLVSSVREAAEKLFAEADADKTKYARPYAVFGLLAGAALVIIFYLGVLNGHLRFV